MVLRPVATQRQDEKEHTVENIIELSGWDYRTTGKKKRRGGGGSSAGGDEVSNVEIQLTGEEYAMVAALRSGSSKKRGGLNHDEAAHPDSPTDYEKTLTCATCGTKGHAKRTCKKRKAVLSNFAVVTQAL